MISPSPQPLRGLGAVADSFDFVLVDQWGVLHEGAAVFPEARAALEALRDAGKPVLVLSNSGKRSADNAARMVELGLPVASYSGIVTSGEATWLALDRRDVAPFDRLGRRCLLISRGGDRSVVAGLDLELTGAVEQADFILLAGLDDDRAEVALWQPLLAQAAARGLPLLCANPDVTMIVTGTLVPGPGLIARAYEDLGGVVTMIGKPHEPIYRICLKLLGDPDPARGLAIGDSLDHDILGGRGLGMRTLLITQGIHWPDLRGADTPDAQAARLRNLAPADRRPDWFMPRLAW